MNQLKNSNQSSQSFSSQSEKNNNNSKREFKRSTKSSKNRLKYALGALLILILIGGGIAAYFLTQKNQDIRQQASVENQGENLLANGDFEAGYLNHESLLNNGEFTNNFEGWTQRGPAQKTIIESDGNKFAQLNHTGDSDRGRIIQRSPIKDDYTYQLEIRAKIENLPSADGDSAGGIYADEWCINQDFRSECLTSQRRFNLIEETTSDEDDFVTLTKRFASARCADLFEKRGFPEKCYEQGVIRHTLPIFADAHPGDKIIWDYAKLTEVTGPNSWARPHWANVGTFVAGSNDDRVYSGDFSLVLKGISFGRNLTHSRLRKTQWLLNEGGGSFYKLSACGKKLDGDDLARVVAEEYTDDNTFQEGHALEFNSDQWECKSISFGTSGETTKIPVSVFLDSPDDGGEIGSTKFFVDDIRLERAAPVPNCKNLTGPSVLEVGQTGTYAAEFYSPQGSLRGRIGVNQFDIIANDTTDQNNLSLSGDWTPQEAGTYLVSCRAWNDGIAECRYADHVDREPRYPCEGPDNYLQVEVVEELTATPTQAPSAEGITLKISLSGVPRIEKDEQGQIANLFHPEEHGQEISAWITLENESGNKSNPFQKSFEYISSATGGYYQTIEPLTQVPAGNYNFLIKGPLHRQMRMCRNGQTSLEQCETTDLVEVAEGQSMTLDFSGSPLQAGDTPIHGSDNDQQDGVVNGLDYSFVLDCLGKQTDPACVARADFDYSGKVTNYDLFLLMLTLSSAADEV